MLATKAINRRVVPSSVMYFVSEIQQGTFATTHQGIAINSSDRLVDGQHRLTAISITGIPQEMSVTYGYSQDAAMQIPLDCGAKRQFYQQVGISTNHAADIDRCLQIVAEDNRRFSTSERMMGLKIIRPLQEKLHEICPGFKRAMSVTVNRVAVLLRISGGNDYAARQYRALVHQAYNEMTPAIQGYCRKLTKDGLKLEETISVKQARAWLAFDPERANNDRQQVPNAANQLNEMRAVLLGLGFEDIRSETKKTAKMEEAVEKSEKKKGMWKEVLKK